MTRLWVKLPPTEIRSLTEMRMRTALIAATTAAIALSGCSNVSRALGAERSTPDEFRTVTIAPLTVPPEYNLRPPRPGEPRPDEIYPDQQARAALLGSQGAFEGSDAEALLVARANGGSADPFIRSIIDGEMASVVRKNRSFADQVLFWRNGEYRPQGDATPLDAEAEALAQERILNVTGGGDVEIERDRRLLPKLPGL
ncbi:conserved hypothetical protein [Maricaulis maris MCS10]|uniref:Beta-barrel assembly complex subunit BamF n=2 Tax=Maricaulaceae TaxID=2800061 RepID=Q0AS29_MARMM|nr:conserved hypothetical protein [Maricaulis maris MCS10]